MEYMCKSTGSTLLNLAGNQPGASLTSWKSHRSSRDWYEIRKQKSFLKWQLWTGEYVLTLINADAEKLEQHPEGPRVCNSAAYSCARVPPLWGKAQVLLRNRAASKVLLIPSPALASQVLSKWWFTEATAVSLQRDLCRVSFTVTVTWPQIYERILLFPVSCIAQIQRLDKISKLQQQIPSHSSLINKSYNKYSSITGDK